MAAKKRKRTVVGDISRAADKVRAEIPAVRQERPKTYVSEDGKTRRRRYVVQPIDKAADKLRAEKKDFVPIESREDALCEAVRLASKDYRVDEISGMLRDQGVDEPTALEVAEEGRRAFIADRRAAGWKMMLAGLGGFALTVLVAAVCFWAEGKGGGWVGLFSVPVVATLGAASWGASELRRVPRD